MAGSLRDARGMGLWPWALDLEQMLLVPLEVSTGLTVGIVTCCLMLWSLHARDDEEKREIR